MVLTSAVCTRSSARCGSPVRITPNRSRPGSAAATKSSKSSMPPQPRGRVAGCPAGATSSKAGVLSVALVGELAAQLQHGFRVHLADPALGDAEHLADLGEGQTLVVVERDDDLLALGQRVDGAGEE